MIEQINTYLIAAQSSISPGNLPKPPADGAQIQEILTVVFWFIGAIAFLMVVISGLRFVLSGGEPDKIAKARSALVYSLIGLLIAVSAQAIVAFSVRML